MAKVKDITTEEFDEAVRDIIAADGIEVVLAIPGVWEIVSEEYNNDAIDLVLRRREEAAARRKEQSGWDGGS